ncbi:MAG: hypothetical protein HUU15_19725, partial [Candidatus Brocadiae bacterium]|nr:hypothetical protein [Candidatus Brocadiia bacterium]
MLSLRTGSFRSLEDELVAALRCRPSLEPASVIVPSGMVRRRLQRACATAGGVMNVRFPDFRSLALGLLDEAGVPALPAVEDRGEDEVFRTFLREPGAPECYRVLADRPGASLLLATVRDLRAAVVTPALMKDVKEELPEDARRLAELARLLELYDAFLARFGLTTRAAVSDQARRCVAASASVRGTPMWAVYGFLEFNGEEKDLFDEIVRAADLTVYVPWRDAPAWSHVDRTLNDDFGMARGRQGGVISAPGEDVDLRSLRTKPPKARGEAGPVTSTHRPTAFTRRLFDPAESPHTGDAPIPVVSASGTADELWYAVKEARRVHESEGVAWRDIGILCRSVDRRLGHAERMFREECVPWTTSARRPLAERPLAQMAALATRIATDDRHHLDVMEWLGSPFLREERRPDEWRIVLENLGIVSGDDWKRLAGARGADLAPPGERAIPAAAVDAFAEAADGLFRALPASPARGWAELAAAWE